ncbi:uridine kinase [Burkholderia ubonensis]|uniref:uridine kinase n=1 Tax=Burkholderia TaxID=32008 RepID=UPI0005AD06CA|nr:MULTISPECIES: uridine kinase [Burkholderia]KIP19210.1 phosphoribulokinase / Uridine kinase family protein [Burkholderia sp. MSHR3999]KVD16509.1 uridine kinase [Burkholderia ubonensis]KVD19226.1 uridine kinase [Burkholderia ubonensis]KVD55732.1 uridine kinase [Burkholderia ubonensis]KVU11849.1 uridine kinase [Burkholderia ubonensis]
MKPIFAKPTFWIGLLLRVALVALVIPHASQVWYVPFMEVTSRHLSWDPWAVFIQAGGAERAFPYGYAMWIAFLPLTWAANLVHLPTAVAYGCTLVLADIALLFTLRALFEVKDRLLLALYWLSPVIIFAVYFLGANDLVPVALLCSSLLALRERRNRLAGAICGAAVSAKLSMLLALPLIAIYLYRNKSMRRHVAEFALGLAAALLLLEVPFFLSSNAVAMLIHNPELAKAREFALGIGNDRTLIVLPVAYLLMLYSCWRIRRISFDLLHVLLGVAFFLVLLMTPAAPGWFVWVMPLLVYYQAMSARVSVALVSAFSIAYIFTALLTSPPPVIMGATLEQTAHLGMDLHAHPQAINIVNSVLIAFGLILVWRIWREAVRQNDYFRLSRKPVVIGIAGDSGAGKDTLVDSIIGLLGQHSVVRVSGDDYHHWDRHKPMWQVMTHLNPRANNLERFGADVLSLANGRSVQARHYDHASGKMSKPHTVASNDFVIASGLHALYQPLLRERYDLTIFLDIDEGLRRYFKIQRDVHKRGHSLEAVLASIEKRTGDAERFVHPQAAHADLVLSLQPIHPRILKDPSDDRPLRFKLVVSSRHGLHEQSLERMLVGICGLHVDTVLVGDESTVEMTIEGETIADDVAMAAQHLIPRAAVLLDQPPRWEDGIAGLMQLMVLSHLTQALQKRLK